MDPDSRQSRVLATLADGLSDVELRVARQRGSCTEMWFVWTGFVWLRILCGKR